MNDQKVNHIQLIYEGPAVEKGQMDISDLGNALLGFKDSYARIHHLANIQHAYTIEVKGFKRGSFVIEFTISINNPVATLLSGTIIGVSFHIGTMELLRFLKGKQPQKIVEKKDMVILENEKGETRQTKALLWYVTEKSIEDKKCVEGFGKMAKPLERSGIDRLIYIVKHQSEKPSESVISADEILSFNYSTRKETSSEREFTMERKRIIAHIRAWDKKTNMGKVTYQGKPLVASFEMANPETFHRYFPFTKPLELECQLVKDENLKNKRVLIYHIAPIQEDLPIFKKFNKLT